MATYTNWSGAALVASESEWCGTQEVLELAANLNAVKFSLQTERIKAIDYITKLNKVWGNKIFSKTQRFPDDRSYVYLQYEDWPGKISQILLAANYKPPENAFIVGNTSSKESDKWGKKPNAPDDAELLQDPTERQKFEKAMVSYFSGIRSINDQIGRRTGVFTMEHFERHFNLTWK